MHYRQGSAPPSLDTAGLMSRIHTVCETLYKIERSFRFRAKLPVTQYYHNCGISIRVLRLLRILTDLNELRINVGHVWALEHCARMVILASTDYTCTTPD